MWQQSTVGTGQGITQSVKIGRWVSLIVSSANAKNQDGFAVGKWLTPTDWRKRINTLFLLNRFGIKAGVIELEKGYELAPNTCEVQLVKIETTTKPCGCTDKGNAAPTVTEAGGTA